MELSDPEVGSRAPRAAVAAASPAMLHRLFVAGCDRGQTVENPARGGDKRRSGSPEDASGIGGSRVQP
jgi:hypothetical protein